MAKTAEVVGRKESTETHFQKTEEEFISSLTSTDEEITPDERGQITIEGGFPQVIRKPQVDKSINGFKRITY